MEQLYTRQEAAVRPRAFHPTDVAGANASEERVATSNHLCGAPVQSAPYVAATAPFLADPQGMDSAALDTADYQGRDTLAPSGANASERAHQRLHHETSG